MPNFGGQPSADARQHPPTITDEMPNVPLTSGAAPTVQGTAGVVTTGDDSVTRDDRILRERAQAQRAADDINELRQAAGGARRPVPKPVVDAPAPPAGEPPIYDPATDAAAIAQMTGTISQPAVEPAAAQPNAQRGVRLPTDVNGAVADAGTDIQEDRGDMNPHSADGMMMTPTQVVLTAPDSPVGPLITRRSSVDPMLSLEQTFASRVASDPANLSNQFEYQLLQFLRDQRSPHTPELAGLNSEDQNLLSAMCDALTNFRSVVRNQPNALSVEKSRPFVEMAERIASQSDLAITSPMLCEEVAAFGNYTPLDARRFQAGSVVPAVFYCEVDGFQPVLNEGQQYETKLSLELKLYSASRELQVWRLPTMNVNDSSRRRRRDFFIAKMIELPANLPADTYLLKAVVKDLQGNRMAEKTLQFVLTQPPGR